MLLYQGADSPIDEFREVCTEGTKGHLMKYENLYTEPLDELHHMRTSSWFPQVQPGNTGHALVVSQVLATSHHDAFYSTSDETIYADQNRLVPWLLPTLIEWHSLTDENGLPSKDVDQFLMPTACVGIRSIESCMSNEKFISNNCHLEFEFDRWPQEEGVIINGIDYFGVIPIHQVYPIREEFVQPLIQTIRDLEGLDKLGLLQFECSCMIEGYHETSCSHEIDYKKDCDCNFAEDLISDVSQLYVDSLNPQIRMNEQSNRLWQNALSNFYYGSETIYQKKEEELWAYYSWLYQSPFSASPGQNAKALKDWQDLTNSQMRQVS